MCDSNGLSVGSEEKTNISESSTLLGRNAHMSESLLINITTTALNMSLFTISLYLYTHPETEFEKSFLTYIVALSSIMLLFHYSFLCGPCTQDNQSAILLVLVFGSLLVLQNTLGVVAIILAMQSSGVARCFVLLLFLLDAAYIYAINKNIQFLRNSPTLNRIVGA